MPSVTEQVRVTVREQRRYRDRRDYRGNRSYRGNRRAHTRRVCTNRWRGGQRIRTCRMVRVRR